MWTPKRVLLLTAGFLLFSLVYLIYSATSLGRINTLPPLPEQYKQGVDPDLAAIVPPATGPTPLEKKLEQAFGLGCQELKRPYLFELNSKSMVMAAGTFEIITDGPVERRGRVKLEPMSLALFGKKKNDGRDIEINTLKCERAYLTFDRPITGISPNELNGRKIVEAELSGNIDIVNNRRTANRLDDLSVAIANGPLYYVENKQLIWTRDFVLVKDGVLEPPKSKIVAKGMDMELATAAPPPKPGTVHKPKNESISGVKRITLKQQVRMDLYVNGSAPFPGSGKDKAAAGAAPPRGPAADAKKNRDSDREGDSERASHVIITTPGRFRYELFKDYDMAYFDVPPDQGQAVRSPQDVVVTRNNKLADGQDKNDQLVCKHLELRVRRRESAASAGKSAASSEQGLEIETAHATGPNVTLVSDVENLDATGNDFFHDAGKKLTVLKGVPYMEANKDGNLIQTPELQMQDIPIASPPGSPVKTYQQVTAAGPGCIHLPKKTGDKTGYTVHAFWKEKLLSTRDGALDLLILTGSARFVDDEQGQGLQAETIRVWLLVEDNKPALGVAEASRPAAGKSSTTPGMSRRPHHIEALRNIVAHSRELNVHDASRLVVRFKDVPESQMPTPIRPEPKASGVASAPRVPASGVASAPRGTTPAPASGVASAPREAPTRGANATPLASTRGANATPLAGARSANATPLASPRGADATPLAGARSANPTPPAAPPAAPSSPPIDLSARSIEADVLRSGERSQLHKLWSEGLVRVHQDPAKPKERGVNIESETLQMTCLPQGNRLAITDEKDMAKLRMDKILIMGAEVNIDQASNTAWVHGSGAMEIDSDTTLDGKPLGRTVPLEILWQDDMLFHNNFAEFKGGVTAEQEKALLACQSLQVMFDRAISLKEGSKSDQPAKVRTVVAYKDVKAENSEMQGNRLQKFQLIEGKTLTMDSVPRDDEGPRSASKGDANNVTVSGPGTVRLLQRGGAELTAAPGMPPPNGLAGPAPTDQPMKLTYVSFGKTMQASNRTNTANFWESVQVLSLPCDDPHREIDLDAMLIQGLPTGAMYMRCNHLKVLNEQVRGKSNQQMEAHGRVLVRAREFQATADHMNYNEAKDQIIFEAEPGNTAYLAQNVGKGIPPKKFTGRKIIYSRSTGNVWGTDGESLSEGN